MITKSRANQNLLFILLSSIILFLFELQFSPIFLSLLQIRISTKIAWIILFVSMSIALAYFLFCQGDKAFLALLKSYKPNIWHFIPFCFLLFCILIYVLLWILAIKMPDLSWDGNMYHIPSMSMWDIKGYIYWVDIDAKFFKEALINGYPKGAELVSYLLVKALNNAFINTGNLMFLPLGILGIANLARSFGANRWLSICAGMAFLLIPINISQSVTTYVDTAFACCVIGLLSTLIYLLSVDTMDWKGNFVFGAAIALTVGVKSTGLAISLFCLLTLVVIWISKGVNILRSSQGKIKPANLVLRGILAILSIILIAALGGGYWYIRNYLMTATPFYPVGLTIFGYKILPGVSISKAISASVQIPPQLQNKPAFVKVIFAWLQGIKAWPASIKGYDSRLGGLGFFWVIACVPAIITSIIFYPKSAKTTRRNLIVLVGLTFLFFIVTPLNWWARFTVWIYALGIPCFAMIIMKLLFTVNLDRVKKSLVIIWVVVCSSLFLFEGVYNTLDVVRQSSYGILNANFGDIVKTSTWNWPTCYLFPDMQGTVLERILLQNDPVAVGPHGEMDLWRYTGLIGQLSQPIGARKLYLFSEQQIENDEIKEMNIKYVIWDDTVTLPEALETEADIIIKVRDFVVLIMPVK